MKTDIYYFTGTGNSLAVAQKIANKIENSTIYSIPQVTNKQKSIKGNLIGIVCPIYMYNIPHIVADFISTIKSADYIFLVYAGGGHLGGAIKDLLKIFASNNLTVSAVCNVPMPSNYTPYGATPKEKQKELFAQVESHVDHIVEIVTKKETYFARPTNSFFETYIHPGLVYKLGYSQIYRLDNSYTVDDKCNGCSICQKVCPVNNIIMKDKKPEWQNKCQQCYACLQWCPTESIQTGKKTIGVKRYHHPEIKAKDIIKSSMQIV